MWIQLIACAERARPLHLAQQLDGPLARLVEENRAPADDVSRRCGPMVSWLAARHQVLVAAHVGLAHVAASLESRGTSHVLASCGLPDYATARLYRAAERYVAAAARSHQIEAAHALLRDAAAEIAAVE